MAQKEHGNREDEKNRSLNNNQEQENANDDEMMHPLEYLRLQENGELERELSPYKKKQEEEQGNENAPQPQMQEAQGNKGKILTAEGLEYD